MYISLPTIPQQIMTAFTHGFTWFVIFFCISILFLVIACKYGNTEKNATCECYKIKPTSHTCDFCITDKILIALIMCSLAMFAVALMRIDKRINDYAIDAAKMDSAIIQMLGEHEQSTKK